MAQNASPRRLKHSFFAMLEPRLLERGFAIKPRKDSFVRTLDGVIHVFQLVLLQSRPGWRVQPDVGVRFDIVETLFHRISGFPVGNHRDTTTIGGGIGNILFGDIRKCECVLRGPEDIEKCVRFALDIFDSVALPYFARYSSLREVDAELNDHPMERTPHRAVPWLRCATGLIVASLVRRRDYGELANTYTDVMTRVDKGFYLERFKALVELLKTVDEPSG